MRLLSAAAVILFASAGCGQKGPLYLRDAPPPGVKPAKPEAVKPAPYPKDPERGDAAEK
jgi:predicted small lipoprotein YifL